MLIVGADPGFTGAIAFLNPATMDCYVHDMPVVASTSSAKTVINVMGLAHLLNPYEGPHARWSEDGRIIGVIEQVHAMPKQGGSSTFRFGEGYGALQMAIAGCGYERHYVTPQKWKKHFRLNSDGNASRGLAIQRFPKLAKSFARDLDHGRAEAVLIALYGAEVLVPKHLQPAA